MPKIIISEKDNTSGGFRAYSNFSVAIPGFVNESKLSAFLEKEENEDKVIFDENDIYECTDPAEFKEAIGLVNPKIEIDIAEQQPTAPEISKVFYVKADSSVDKPESWPGKNYDPELDLVELIGVDGASADDDFAQALEDGTLYQATATANTTVGKLKDLKYVYTQITPSINGTISVAVDDLDGEAGDDNALVLVGAQQNIQTNSFYCILSDIGSDGSKKLLGTVYHHGNQIAYELLNLGYTVLYKKLGNELQDVDTEVSAEGSIPVLKYQTALESDEFWKPFKDKTTYDFRYVMTGLIENTAEAGNAITRLAEGVVKESDFKYDTSGRGDCFALVDIDRTRYANNQNTSQAVNAIKKDLENYTSSAYSALFAPTVRYAKAQLASADECKNTEMPASFHYLACAANAFSNFNEWYAVAGYTRGVSRLTVVGTGAKFGDLAVEELQPRTGTDGVDKAVNLIINLKGSYYIWGNRTSYKLSAEEELKAQHFLNIRQLCTTIKKQTWTACRRYTYDPNSDVLWIKFCAAIKPTLDKMKADQGISDYKITKRKTDKKGVLSARIRIVPIEAVEDFYINLSLEDSLVGVVMDEDETA